MPVASPTSLTAAILPKIASSNLRPKEIVMIETCNINDDLFHCVMDHYHYLGCHGHVGKHLKHMVFDRSKRPLACLLFGSVAWKIAARDNFFDRNASTRRTNPKLMTDNTRFLILPWVGSGQPCQLYTRCLSDVFAKTGDNVKQPESGCPHRCSQLFYKAFRRNYRHRKIY